MKEEPDLKILDGSWEAGKNRRKRPCNQREEEGCGSPGSGCAVVNDRVRAERQCIAGCCEHTLLLGKVED